MSRKGGKGPADWGPLLRNGLSSHKSYIMLRQKARSAVYLCFKPFITRLSGEVLYVGGKLSVFPEYDNPKWQELMPAGTRIEALRTAFRKLPADRVSDHRVGSHAGFYVVARSSDKDIFETKFDKAKMLNALLLAIEEQLKVEIDNVAEVTAYLSKFYHDTLGSVFGSGYDKANVPARVIGKRSDVLFGQSYLSEYNNDALTEFLVSVGLLEAPAEAE